MISSHSISGCAARVSAETLLAASPMVCTQYATALRSVSSPFHSANVTPCKRSITFRAYDSMSSSETESTLFDIFENQIVLHVGPEHLAYVVDQIDLPAYDRRQFPLRAAEVEEADVHRIAILHQHIHVAPRRVEVVPHHRPEERQLADAPLPAELGDPVVGNGDGELAGGRHVLHFTG